MFHLFFNCQNGTLCIGYKVIQMCDFYSARDLFFLSFLRVRSNSFTNSLAMGVSQHYGAS